MSAPVCCAPVAAGPVSDDDALQVAMRLKAIADPVRVKIMSQLFSSTTGEVNGGELAEVLGLTRIHGQPSSGPVTQSRTGGSDRRGMNVFHRARRDALAALCVVLDPNCCS